MTADFGDRVQPTCAKDAILFGVDRGQRCPICHAQGEQGEAVCLIAGPQKETEDDFEWFLSIFLGNELEVRLDLVILPGKQGRSGLAKVVFLHDQVVVGCGSGLVPAANEESQSIRTMFLENT